jgi:hypothetical protein
VTRAPNNSGRRLNGGAREEEEEEDEEEQEEEYGQGRQLSPTRLLEEAMQRKLAGSRWALPRSCFWMSHSISFADCNPRTVVPDHPGAFIATPRDGCAVVVAVGGLHFVFK